MAFKLDDLIIDRIQYGVAEDFSGNLLYTLTQLNNATINITATSRDINDARGTLVKRFWDGCDTFANGKKLAHICLI